MQQQDSLFATGLEKVLVQGIGFVQGVVLARLLMPVDFRISAMLRIAILVPTRTLHFTRDEDSDFRKMLECKHPYMFYLNDTGASTDELRRIAAEWLERLYGR